VRFELDLRDVAPDVVSAWLRYLYTQDNLTLIWPCSGEDQEEADVAEKFWTELLRLAQRLGDDKLRLYAEDTLIGALSRRNWTHLAAFAEQVRCSMLSEAALMMGIRWLMPSLLASFCVSTGLEQGTSSDISGSIAREDRSDKKEKPHGSGLTEQVATVGRTAPGRLFGAACGPVDLELEKHLFELQHTASKSSTEPMAVTLLALKKASPAQFSELKNRLSDGIVTAQRVGAQLGRCAKFFDSHEKRGFKRDDSSHKALWIELALLAGTLGFFFLPTTARQVAFSFVAQAIEPLRAWTSWVDLGPLLQIFGSGILRIAIVNVLMVLALCIVVWSGLKK